MQRVPELAGRELTLVALSGGITNRNFLRRRAAGYRPNASSSAWPATTRTCSGSAARSSTRRPSRPPAWAWAPRSPRSSGRRATSSPASSRGRRSADEAVHRPATHRAASPTRCGASTRPGDPGPVHPAPRCRGVPGARRGPRRPRSRRSTRSPRPSAGGSSSRCSRTRSSSGPATTTSCNAQPHRRRGADADRGLGVRRHGRPVLRPRQLQRSTTSSREDEDAAFLAAYDGVGAPRPTGSRGSRCCGSCRTSARRCGASSSRAISTLDVDFRATPAEHFDRLLAERGDAALRARAGRGGRRLIRRALAAGRLGAWSQPPPTPQPRPSLRARRRDRRRRASRRLSSSSWLVGAAPAAGAGDSASSTAPRRRPRQRRSGRRPPGRRRPRRRRRRRRPAATASPATPSPAPARPDPHRRRRHRRPATTTTTRQTAALVDGNEGIVFTLGDNAYDDGSTAEFRDCYDPTWGRVKDRTELPVPGNHDYAHAERRRATATTSARRATPTATPGTRTTSATGT